MTKHKGLGRGLDALLGGGARTRSDGELAQPRDQELARQDQHDHPCREEAELHHPDEGGHREHLVGKRVHELPEGGDPAVAAGERPVIVIGDRRGDEHQEREQAQGRFGAHGEPEGVGDERHQEEGDDHDPAQGELVGKIHRRFTRRSAGAKSCAHPW